MVCVVCPFATHKTNTKPQPIPNPKPNREDYFAPVMDAITTGGDYYLLANDFPSYLDAQARVDAAYRDKAAWARMSVMSVAGSGKFSTDRTIQEYADDIWRAAPCPVPTPR